MFFLLALFRLHYASKLLSYPNILQKWPEHVFTQQIRLFISMFAYVLHIPHHIYYYSHFWLFDSNFSEYWAELLILNCAELLHYLTYSILDTWQSAI